MKKKLLVFSVLIIFLIALIFIIKISLNNNSNNSTEDLNPEYSDNSALKNYNYNIAVHPLYNPDKLFIIFQPLVDYLNKNIPELKLKLIASKDYGSFEKKLYNKEFDLAMPNPLQTLISLKYGYHVFGKMGDDYNFTGIILLRKDSDIKSINDLKGKTLSYPSATALAACMMPQYFLYENGIDINKDITNLYVGSQESSILNVYLKNVDAGVTWPLPWIVFQKEQPEKASELEVKWETDYMINNGLVYRENVPKEIIQKIDKYLFNLQDTEEGRNILKLIEISKFERADDQTYDKIKDFLKEFNDKIRKIEY